MSDEKQVATDQTGGEDKTEKNESTEQTDNKDFKSVLAQKEHFREKSEKLEKEKEELLAKVETAEKKETPTQTKTEIATEDLTSLKEDLAKIKFSQAHLNMEAGDIEEVFKLAAMNSQTPEEILEKNPMVVAYMEKKAKDKKVSDATPTTNRGYSIKPDKPLKEMSREEHEAWAKKVLEQS